MALTLALATMAVLVIVLLVLAAKEHAPSPEEVAVAYERAWDRFDFETLWDLSGSELRDGRDRAGFITAKRDAFADQTGLRGLVGQVTATSVSAEPDSAIVVTTVATQGEKPNRNQCTLARRSGRWFVVGYAHADA